jgi:hypothetical protein
LRDVVHLSHNGLELWYATPDAPAPIDIVEPRQGVSITVRVRPANPINSVSVRYRVDGGIPHSIPALLVSTDYRASAQYFKATFPPFWSGQTVEYLPILSSAGRLLPGPAELSGFPSSFQLEPTPVVQRNGKPALQRPRGLFPFELEYLVTKHVTLAHKPELIGETPEGFLMHWSPTGGTVDGPAFRATVHPEGEHEMLIRPDGIGEQSVRVTLETDDHALISVRYSGLIDLGMAGSALARNQRWPKSAAVHSAPRLLTAHSKYQWLNRLQCIAVGEVRPYDLLYIYDLYAVR